VKRALCLLLALLFTFTFTTMVFAADEKIDDPLLPTSPDIVIEEQYGNIQEFEDDPTPETAPVVDILEEELPEALPQTGGIPAEVFYIIGGICIISAVLLLSRKSKPSAK
jgi:LPXTG-motif cell wall-anchored protein